MFKEILSTSIIAGILLFTTACAAATRQNNNLSTTPPQDQSTEAGINSSGTTMPASSGGSEPGAVTGNDPDGNDGMDQNKPKNWLTYTDAKFGFSISYPDTYLILPEDKLPTDGIPGLTHRVRFLNSDLAKSDTANLQPPDFSIELFESDLPLNQWFDVNAQKGSVEQVQIDKVDCMKVTMQTLIAPNQFYFCAWGKQIYQITPLGEYADQMLKSFQFGK